MIIFLASYFAAIIWRKNTMTRRGHEFIVRRSICKHYTTKEANVRSIPKTPEFTECPYFHAAPETDLAL